MTKTNRDVIVFSNIAGKWAQEHPALSRFGYALSKLNKQLAKTIEAYQDASEDLNVEHCAVNKDSHLLKDATGYIYTKDGRKALDKARRELLEKEVEVTPFMVKAVPDELPVEILLALEGFVLPDGFTETYLTEKVGDEPAIEGV